MSVCFMVDSTEGKDVYCETIEDIIALEDMENMIK